jgi:hypothetical protein
MYQCKVCGLSGGSDQFYPNSKSRCRLCVNAINRERYIQKYGPELKAARRAKGKALKSVEVILPETERAYAAGLIDGEGCIRITKRGAGGGASLRPGQLTLMVEVTNTDYDMVAWLQDRFGGSVSHYDAKPERNAKEKWHWRVAANKALYCLDAIWPYARTKRHQVKLGRRFQRYVQHPGRFATPKIRRVQERFNQALRILNKRGVN